MGRNKRPILLRPLSSDTKPTDLPVRQWTGTMTTILQKGEKKEHPRFVVSCANTVPGMLFSTYNGYCTFLLARTQDRYRKNFYVRSSETPVCSCSDHKMIVIGSRKRSMFKTDGERIHLIIRRLRCRRCQKIHHELPDIIVPHKHHCAETIEEILADRESAAYPCETSTAMRLRRWFLLLRGNWTSALTAVKARCQQEKQLADDLCRLTPIRPSSLSDGWLKRVVRILVNSGFWIQTRLA